MTKLYPKIIIKSYKIYIEDSLISSLKLRRSKLFKRQNRVPEEREVRRQVSEPTSVVTPPPSLKKHDSYPQYTAIKSQTPKPQKCEQEVGSVFIRAVTVIDRQSTSSSGATSTCTEAEASVSGARASHTPAVRSGPPLSCNFCWNTIDECGRILRRKTQYHCPECRTNLCIVPCFHEYHETEVESSSTNIR